MDKHNWFSERLNQWLDLDKLPKEELIAEIFTERKSYLDIEDALQRES